MELILGNFFRSCDHVARKACIKGLKYRELLIQNVYEHFFFFFTNTANFMDKSGYLGRQCRNNIQWRYLYLCF